MNSMDELPVDEFMSEVFLNQGPKPVTKEFDMLVSESLKICSKHGQKLKREEEEDLWFTTLDGLYTLR